MVAAPALSPHDLFLFREGTLYHAYRAFGAHQVTRGGADGVRFAVWAPHAREVRVVGEFNGWDGRAHRMSAQSGVWSAFVPGIGEGCLYKYEIHPREGEPFLKADPFAFHSEMRPGTASRVFTLERYDWGDAAWLEHRESRQPYEGPMLIYEVHLGSWKRHPNGKLLSYREIADELIAHVRAMGYTHIELLPIAEHPLDRSWGYQITGYYSVTSRHGDPRGFMYLVDMCHQNGIGVLLDWVPGHFCRDAHGLRLYDGTPLYEYSDPERADHPEWGTSAFDLGKPEVRSFLISNAVFWHDIYHIDGLRTDAVASMLYLDYGRMPHQWKPNKYGGKENLEALEFLRQLNRAVFGYYPSTLMVAEESTAWPLVSRPVHRGGLGFNYKWNMGWMNDVLEYMKTDPIYRKWSHNSLTFSMMYSYSENFILPLSHDEVVYGKRSLLNRMPGDYWQKFANLRLLLGYFMTHPGKKLLFMGGEFGQFDEWKDSQPLDWHVLDHDMHAKMMKYSSDLNRFYACHRSLWELDHDSSGFEWIEPDDADQSIISFLRKSRSDSESLIVICNFTPVVHEQYRIGVTTAGRYKELFNSDLQIYGGSGQGNDNIIIAGDLPVHGKPHSLTLRIPPLAIAILRSQPHDDCDSQDAIDG